MGVIRRGILGGLSGKVANVVGSSWKGIAVLKSLPLNVANPRTAAQVTQRDKFAQCVAFAKGILTQIIKPLNDRFASGQSGFNLFIQRNIDFFDETGAASPDDIKLSEGTVTPAENAAVAGDRSDNEIVVTWDDNTGTGDALADDVAYIVIVNNTNSQTAVSNSEDRATGTATIVMPAGWLAGQVLTALISFRRSDGTKVSNTVAVNAAIVA